MGHPLISRFMIAAPNMFSVENVLETAFRQGPIASPEPVSFSTTLEDRSVQSGSIPRRLRIWDDTTDYRSHSLRRPPRQTSCHAGLSLHTCLLRLDFRLNPSV